MAGAKRVDVEPAAPRVACINRQAMRLAARPDVHEDALHALLMKLVVVAKAHDVLQQAFLVDLRAGVADLYAAPVGLAGDQTVAFEQVAGQRFLDRGFVKLGKQQLGLGCEMQALHVKP